MLYQPLLGTYNTSALVYGSYYYTLLDQGFLLCHDARTGAQIYGRQRISPDASGFTASPWAYNGKIFLLSEDGDTFVVQAGPEFELLGKNTLNEMVLATPAVVPRQRYHSHAVEAVSNCPEIESGRVGRQEKSMTSRFVKGAASAVAIARSAGWRSAVSLRRRMQSLRRISSSEKNSFDGHSSPLQELGRQETRGSSGGFSYRCHRAR